MSGERAEVSGRALLEAVEADMRESGELTEEQDAAVEEQPEDQEVHEDEEQEPADDRAADSEQEAEPEAEEAEAESGEQDEPDAEPSKRSWKEALSDPNIDWEGFIEAKLEELPPAAAKQRQYLSRLAAEYQEKLREFEQRGQAQAQPQQPDKPAEKDEEPPPPDYMNDDAATIVAKQKAREDWIRRQAVNDAKQELDPYLKQLEQLQQQQKQHQEAQLQQAVQARLDYIKNIPGWSPEVQDQMDVLVEENKELATLAWNDDGARRLFAMAKMYVDERNSKSEATKRKVTAKDRSITPSKPRSAVSKTEKTITGDSMEDIAREMANLDEFRGLFAE